MAAITAAQIVKVWSDGAADLTALYRISRVTAGDTVDIGPSGVVTDFQLVKQAAVLATTVSGTAAASVSGTVITMPSGLNQDAGYLLVWGDTN